MIIFRTDANEKIATGHLMRSLSIAAECRRQTEVCFVFADDTSESLLKELCPTWQDYDTMNLGIPYGDPEAELAAFSQILTVERPSALFVDSYAVTPNYLATLNKKAPTYYLDDLKAFDYPVHKVINYNDNPAYAPLRAQFRDVPYKVRKNIIDILITAGGSDEAGMTETILRETMNALTEPVNTHVVLGVLNRQHDRLHDLAATDARITLYENISDMAALMKGCDLAISAAGSTIYELCAIGVPTICFTSADNQINGATALAAENAVIYATDRQFAKHIRQLAADYHQREALSANMRSLIDGYGATRIAEELLSHE
jgi:spore coat polysaccharide biosynthesis predicted glycosyltransferase SpsG